MFEKKADQMAIKIAYRLYTNKYEADYVKQGFTLDEAMKIIDYASEFDEDFLNKKEYISCAKSEAQRIADELNLQKPLDWKLLFGEPVDIGWRYCTKCDTFFWADDECECDYYW